jgi:hypothetical protein
MELANGFEPVQDGRIHIEKINWPMLHDLKATPAEYRAGLDYAIRQGWLRLHESGALREVHGGGPRRCLRENPLTQIKAAVLI